MVVVEFPISQISGVAQELGVIFGGLAVTTSGAREDIGIMLKTEVVHVRSVISQLIEGYHQKQTYQAGAV